MPKKSTAWTVLIYGLVIMGLGYTGYTQGKSMMSLYMGGGFGILLAISAVFMFMRKRFASYAALILTLGLTATFATRYSMTGKGLPAILAVVSGGMLLYLLARTIHWKK